MPAGPGRGVRKGPPGQICYGCKGGDHTGYAIVEARSISEALFRVPDFLQDKACVSKVDKFTPGEIKSLHAEAA